jgi:hypothetical protein
MLKRVPPQLAGARPLELISKYAFAYQSFFAPELFVDV